MSGGPGGVRPSLIVGSRVGSEEGFGYTFGIIRRKVMKQMDHISNHFISLTVGSDVGSLEEGITVDLETGLFAVGAFV